MTPTDFIQRCIDEGIPVEWALKAARVFEDAVIVDDLLTVRQRQNRRAYAKRKEAEAAEKLLKPAETAESQHLLKPAENLLKGAEIQQVSAPLARVGDITSTTEGPCRTVVDDLRAWDGKRLDELKAKLVEAAGTAMNLTSTQAHVLTPILRLLKPGDGPPCDLELDVLPVVAAMSARAKNGSISGWRYFAAAIAGARDERLAGAPAVVVVDFTAKAQGPPKGSYAALEAEQAAVRAEARRRLLESP